MTFLLIRAQAGDRANSLLLARIGHELFTPLNHMQLYVHLLRDEWLGESEAKDLDRIPASSRTLESLIRKFMRYADLEAGGEEPARSAFPPVQLAREIAEQFVREAATKGLGFAFEQGGDTPADWIGDPDRTGDIRGSSWATP